MHHSNQCRVSKWEGILISHFHSSLMSLNRILTRWLCTHFRIVNISTEYQVTSLLALWWQISQIEGHFGSITYLQSCLVGKFHSLRETEIGCYKHYRNITISSHVNKKNYLFITTPLLLSYIPLHTGFLQVSTSKFKTPSLAKNLLRAVGFEVKCTVWILCQGILLIMLYTTTTSFPWKKNLDFSSTQDTLWTSSINTSGKTQCRGATMEYISLQTYLRTTLSIF